MCSLLFVPLKDKTKYKDDSVCTPRRMKDADIVSVMLGLGWIATEYLISLICYFKKGH